MEINVPRIPSILIPNIILIAAEINVAKEIKESNIASVPDAYKESEFKIFPFFI